MKYTEHNLQVQCVHWFKLQYPKCLIASSLNGAKRNIRDGSRLRAAGMLKGFPDLFVCEPKGIFHGLFIEMKSKNGQMTKEQKEIAQKLQAKGYATAICKNFETFVNLVKVYMQLEDSLCSTKKG